MKTGIQQPDFGARLFVKQKGFGRLVWLGQIEFDEETGGAKGDIFAGVELERPNGKKKANIKEGMS